MVPKPKAIAQVDDITVGVKGGLSLFHLAADSAVNINKMKQGYNAGLLIFYEYNRNWGYYADISLNQRGYRIEDNLRGESGYRYTYLEVPLMVRYKFPISQFKIYPQIGINIAYALKKRYEQYETAESRAFHVEPWLENDRRFDFGLIAGLGASMRIRREDRIGIDLRYIRSLTNFHTRKIGKFESFNISFSYSIPLKVFMQKSGRKVRL